MSVRDSQPITVLFTTRAFATGVGTNADTLPTGTLYVSGTANAASVTVTNVTTGLYKAAVTLPALAMGDVVDLRIAATVSAVSDNAVIWRDTKDVLLNSAGMTTDAVQTGDTFARIGANGAGLTSIPYTGPSAGTIQAGLATSSALAALVTTVGAAGAGLTSVALASAQVFNNTGQTSPIPSAPAGGRIT